MTGEWSARVMDHVMCGYSHLQEWYCKQHCNISAGAVFISIGTYTLFVQSGPGTHFTNDFLPAIQIRWKLRLAITPLLAIRSQQFFAHATTAVVPYTKFCSDHGNGVEVRVKRNFHRIWIAMEKPLVKRGPGFKSSRFITSRLLQCNGCL